MRHPERSEGSPANGALRALPQEIPRCARDDGRAATAAGVLGMLLLGAIVAWFAKAFRRWLAPEAVVGVLAGVTLAAMLVLRFA